MDETGSTRKPVISYTYDNLYRLIGADYLSADDAIDGSYFAYTYDAVGNKRSDTTLAGTTVYTYDVANRLTNLSGGISYTWDANGNPSASSGQALLADGTFTYTYDAANRLITATTGVTSTGFVYNGLGDRTRQSVNGVAVTYTLDLEADLTQVLADGTFTYLYGSGRVAQATLTETEYFLGDALGSVRQLIDDAGDVTLARRYEPYGEVLSSTGTGTTSYGFTGELFAAAMGSRLHGTPM